MLANAFLILNGIMYLGLGIWCTVSPDGTSKAIGFGLTNTSARSEYIVVYGGLEIGIGLFCLICAFRHQCVEAGLWFLALTFTALMAFRWVTILRFEDLSRFVYTMVAIETPMAVIAILLLIRQVRAAG